MDVNSLNWVDFVIAGIILFSAFLGLIRGFVKEAISLLGFILAIWAAISLSDDFQGYLSPFTSNSSLSLTLSFVIVFFGTLLIFALINIGISKIIKVSGLGISDRLIGVIFGFIRGALFVSVIVICGQAVSFSKTTWWNNSAYIPYFEPVSDWLRQYIPLDFISGAEVPPAKSSATPVKKPALPPSDPSEPESSEESE